MAYRESVCTDMDQVPQLVANFASSVGWTATQDSAAWVLRRPVGEGAPGTATPIRVKTIKATINSTNYEAVAIGAQANGDFSADAAEAARSRFALVRSPWLTSGARQPTIPKPTKLHCFGGGLPEPFLAFVIEYGFNQYRPFYIGTLDGPALGTGEVISCVTGPTLTAERNYGGSSLDWSGMFSGREYNAVTSGLSHSRGGVFIDGKNDDVTAGFSRFRVPSTSQDPGVTISNPGRGIWGGPRDGVDDALISHGFSPFSGDVLLSSINLYTVVGSGAEGRANLVGSVRGVRAVNMRFLEPGGSFQIGNKLWRVFPQARKHSDAAVKPGASDSNGWVYPREETSWFWGLAYLEGNAS